MTMLYYLSSPYAKYPGGIEEAFKLVRIAASYLLANNVHVFSPIVHNHPISKAEALKDYDWLREDVVFMPRMDGMILFKMPTWEKSIGMALEMGHFIAEDKPIYELECPLPERFEWKQLTRFTHYTIDNAAN
jgi:nucleoside 2-deoxyribosyltransferase